MAKRGQEFESDHRSKACKLDFDVDDDDDDYDNLNLEEESMQVDEELDDNLLGYDAVEKRPDSQANLLQSKELELLQRDVKKNDLGKSSEGQETTDAIVTSPCDPKDNQNSRKDKLESGRKPGRKKDEISQAPNLRLTNGEEIRTGQRRKSPPEPRGYQLELAGPAIAGENSIICAPTGSGKTMTASLVCRSLAEKKAGSAAGVCADGPSAFKAVFVVCLRNLVAQQRAALCQYLPNINVGMLDEQQFLDVALEMYDIVVLTSQILVNALKQGEVCLNNLSLVIFDECHHTNLEHPYNKLMQLYHLAKIKGSKDLPQILGMTASLGVGSASDLGGAKDHYVQICANLDCARISHVRDPKNKAELAQVNPKPSKDQLKMVDKRPQNKEFYLVMERLMKDIETNYLREGALQVARGQQGYESKVSTLRLEAEKTKETADEMVACEVLSKINLAWMIHDELRTKDALQLLNKYFRENLESKPGSVEKALCQFYCDARRELERIEKRETLEDWPLLKELHRLLEQLFRENAESHGIVMASTILYVDGLMSFLQDFSPSELVFPKKFVGHRHNIENTITVKEQEDVLLQFRKGIINVLVSTDVTQEGLDIPNCNFVIRFNFVSNEIGAVQAKGRARAPDSRCFLIANRDSVNVEREMKNIGKERWMLDALDQFVSTSDNEIQELVKKRQEDMYKRLRAQGTPMEAAATGDSGSSQFSIHCKRCKAFLCSSDHLVIYGSHYICTDEAFRGRVVIENHPSPKEFRDDTLIGKTVCLECKNNIGSFMTYKRGSRPDGYNLGKESVMWKKQSGTTGEMERYGAIKQWKNVPFVIRQETRNA